MLKRKNKYTVAVVGATGAVGKEMVEILEERGLPVKDLVPLASERSEGERITFSGRNWTVKKLARESFRDVDIAFFCAGASQSLEFVPAAVHAGAVVIDSSSAFRMDSKVPLVVPEVNAHAIAGHAGIIASPDDATIGLVMVMNPIHEAATIKRVVVTTFQSVSGTGKKAIDELAGQTVALLNFRDVEKDVYPHQIAFNCIPHIDVFLDNGSTGEEKKIADEAGKIMETEAIRIAATAVRVPVFRGHSAAINIEMAKKLTANDVRAILAGTPGVVVYDDPQKNIYPLAIDVAGKDEIYAGRIREDESVPNGIGLWLVWDNIRKGAALNMVQIAEVLLQENGDVAAS